MTDNKRQHSRAKRNINMQYCLAGVLPVKWDMLCVIENISVGGIKFSAPTDLKLKGKIIQLQIKAPELAPGLLEIEAMVLDAQPRTNSKHSDVRAKFINLTDKNKEHLSIIGKMIERQEMKNTRDSKF